MKTAKKNPLPFAGVKTVAADKVQGASRGPRDGSKYDPIIEKAKALPLGESLLIAPAAGVLPRVLYEKIVQPLRRKAEPEMEGRLSIGITTDNQVYVKHLPCEEKAKGKTRGKK